MKKAILFGFIIACMALVFVFPRQMINPGDLVQDHQKLKDKCFSCHEPFYGIPNDKCISCHKLDEIGKSDLQSDTGSRVNFHRQLSGQSCTTCHTDHKGLKPLRKWNSFNHDMLPSGIIANCNSCHNRPADNLHVQITAGCKTCHNTNAWRLSVSFNHDMIRPSARNNCTSCHSAPSDGFHNQLRENCTKCHSTTHWKPSTFDHSTYFVLDGDHNAQCNTCHTDKNNFRSYTCYGCHEHSTGKIMEEHNEHGIYNFNNCASCHRSGDEHDIRMDGNRELNPADRDKMKEYIRSNEGREQKHHSDHDDD